MMRTLLKIATISALALGTAACFGDDNDVAVTTPTPPAPTTPAPPAARFSEVGAGFATSFGASANSEPREATAADVGAVSLTTEPANVS